MSRPNFFLFLLLSVVLVLSIVIIKPSGLLKITQSLSPNQTYSDVALGYSITFPKDWKTYTTSGFTQFVAPSEKNPINPQRFEVYVIPTNQTLDEYMASISGNLQKLQISNYASYKESASYSGAVYSSYYLKSPSTPFIFMITFSSDFEKQPLLREKILSSLKFTSQVIPTVFPLPTSATSSADLYICPANGWVDCMPNVGTEGAYCTQEYLKWATRNCPNFQGVAY